MVPPVRNFISQHYLKFQQLWGSRAKVSPLYKLPSQAVR